jgi:predicted ester cyclase
VSTEENKELVRRCLTDVHNGKNLAAFETYYALSWGDDFKRFLSELWRAFPDLHVVVDAQVAEGDLVASRVTSEMTHHGAWQGIAPTGRRVRMPGMSFDRVVGGKIVDHWSVPDFLGVVTQLGGRVVTGTV